MVVVLAGVAVLGVALAAVVVPRLAASDGVRRRLVAAVHKATGREFAYRELHARLLPPRAELLDARLAGPRADAPPFLEVKRVSLRLALLPLLAGVLAADPLVVEGATVQVERGPDGSFSWPGRVRVARGPRAAGTSEAKRPRRGTQRGQFAVRTLELRDVRLVMEDGRKRWLVEAGESRGRAVVCGPERFAVDMKVTDARVDLAQARAHGDLVLQADLRGRRGAGAYRLDATHADVVFHGYPKPDETPAVFTLDLRREGGRFAWNAPSLELLGKPLTAFRESPCAGGSAP